MSAHRSRQRKDIQFKLVEKENLCFRQKLNFLNLQNETMFNDNKKLISDLQEMTFQRDQWKQK